MGHDEEHEADPQVSNDKNNRQTTHIADDSGQLGAERLENARAALSANMQTAHKKIQEKAVKIKDAEVLQADDIVDILKKAGVQMDGTRGNPAAAADVDKGDKKAEAEEGKAERKE